MKFLILATFAMAISVQTMAAKKTIKIRNIVVEKQTKFNFEGKDGLLVKFNNVKKEIFLPLEGKNNDEATLQALKQSQEEKTPLKIELSRTDKDIIQYKGRYGTEILAMGADCRKTKSTNSPRLFCNKGYLVESAELNIPEGELEEE